MQKIKVGNQPRSTGWFGALTTAIAGIALYIAYTKLSTSKVR